MSNDLPTLIPPDSVLSVAGLTAYIQATLEQDDALRQIWVTGEVSSVAQYSSGLFFTLQDPDGKASISCVVWSNYVNRLTTLPRQGDQVIVLSRIRVHAPRGQYQLNVWQVLPAGEGLLALRYRQLRQRLEAEGLFDTSRKRSLPKHPQTIAVVTSPRAAAWGDIQRTLKRRYPGLKVLFSPALVQGTQAPASIAAAIQRVEQDGRAEVLILSRGGGAKEDMACFNDERVVRAVAECSIPVISGIGHQRDEALADLAADVCAHTPTAAAAQASASLEDLLLEHQERVLSLQKALETYLESEFTYLQRLRDHLGQLKLDRILQREEQSLNWLRQRLHKGMQQKIQRSQSHCQLLQEKLMTLDPHAVLRRGYAVVRQAEQIVRSTEGLAMGDEVLIQLAQGQFQAKITEIL